MRYFPFLWLAGFLFLGACKPVIALQWDPTAIPAGRSMVYKSITETETDLSLPGKMTPALKETSIAEYTLTLDQVNPDGSSAWTRRILRYRKEKTQGDSTQVFDSSLPSDDESIEQMVNKAMNGIEFQISVAPNGDIVQIDGIEAMIDQMTNAVPPELQPVFRQTLTGLVGKNASLDFGKNMMTFTPVARQKIKKGKSWMTRQPISAFNANAEIRYELLKETPELVELVTEHTIKTNEETPEIMDLGSVQIQMNIEGTGAGSVSLDKRWKTVRKMYTEYTLSGNMQISMPTLAAQKLPVHIRAKTWVEML